MTAIERFIAGEDRLSAVLGAVPFFDAPATLASWMNRTARSVEDERAAAANPCVFEPSARLRDAVLQEAWALERAQTPRRQALRAALAREADIGKILGAPVAPATEAWLRDIWARQEKSPRAAAPPSPPARQRPWWKPGLAFGTGLGAALLAVLAVRHLGNIPEIPPLLAAADAPLIVTTPDADDWMPPPPSRPAPDENLRAAKPTAPARAASTEAVESETETPVLRQPASAPLADRAQVAHAAPAPAPADEPLPPQREDDLAAADIWLLGAAQWKRLATSFRHAPIPHADAPSSRNKSAPQQPWRLLVSTPEAPEALALAAFLRQSLPPGAELLIHADPAIPAGFARLAPPRQP
jgi:hypothetical protein